MNKDALGRQLSFGDICVYCSRRKSELFLEPVLIQKFEEGGVRGSRIVARQEKRGWTYELIPTKLIVRPDYLVITGLTLDQAARWIIQQEKEKDGNQEG